MTFYNSGRSLRQLLQCLRSQSLSLTTCSTSWFQSIPSSSGSAQFLGGGSTSSSSSSRCLCRTFSDYAAPGRGAAGSSLRRVNPGGRAGSGSSADRAASTSGQAGSTASMMEMKEVPGGSKPLRRWEYYYWGLGATGISYFLYNRLKEPEKTPEEIEETERKLADLRVRRKDHVRAVLMQQNFLLGDDDPLDGLTPAQIVMFLEKYNIDPTDPLEGLTPEEIDAYMAQQEAQKQQQEQQDS